MNELELLRVDEVARLLSIGRSTAYQLVATGVLPTVRIGRAVRVPRVELDAWVRERARGNAPAGDQ